MTYLSLARLDLERNAVTSSETNTLCALRIHEAVLPRTHRAFVDSWAILAKVRSYQGLHAEAEELFNRSISLARETYTTNHWVPTALQVGLAPSIAAQGRLDEAEGILLKAHEAFHATLGPNDSRTQEVLKTFERIYSGSTPTVHGSAPGR
jgi:tetratricopeptide (TPR) repeat protein